MKLLCFLEWILEIFKSNNLFRQSYLFLENVLCCLFWKINIESSFIFLFFFRISHKVLAEEVINKSFIYLSSYSAYRRHSKHMMLTNNRVEQDHFLHLLHFCCWVGKSVHDTASFPYYSKDSFKQFLLLLYLFQLIHLPHCYPVSPSCPKARQLTLPKVRGQAGYLL